MKQAYIVEILPLEMEGAQVARVIVHGVPALQRRMVAEIKAGYAVAAHRLDRKSLAKFSDTCFDSRRGEQDPFDSAEAVDEQAEESGLCECESCQQAYTMAQSWWEGASEDQFIAARAVLVLFAYLSWVSVSQPRLLMDNPTMLDMLSQELKHCEAGISVVQTLCPSVVEQPGPTLSNEQLRAAGEAGRIEPTSKVKH